MDTVPNVYRVAGPLSEGLEKLAPELLEMICRFLHAQDIVQLSLVSKATYDCLGQRISDIGIRSIGLSLSERRPEEALAMLDGFCQWLASGAHFLSESDRLGVWRSVQALAGHACFSQEQQDQAFRQVFFRACPLLEVPTDDVLRLLQDVRAAWFCRCFPEGGIFSDATPCRSFTFIAPYLEGRPYWQTQDPDIPSSSIPSKQVAWLGACIEAIRLGCGLASASAKFSAAALHLLAAFEETPSFFRVSLALDLIECIKRFPAEERPALLSHVLPLVDAADGEERTAYLLAVLATKDPTRESPDEYPCSIM